MHNRNNEFILIIYIVRRKMANFRRRDLKIGLEFGRSTFAKLNNSSKGSSEPKKYTQVIRVRGWQPHEFLNLNYLFCQATFGRYKFQQFVHGCQWYF